MIASWAPDTQSGTLQVNWTALQLDPTSVTLAAPVISGFEEATTWPSPNDPITGVPGKGWLLVLETKHSSMADCDHATRQCTGLSCPDVWSNFNTARSPIEHVNRVEMEIHAARTVPHQIV